MNERILYWVWLQQVLGYSNAKVRTVTKFFPSAQSFYEAGLHEWRLCGCFTAKELERMQSCTIDDAEIILEKSQKEEYTLITLEDEAYPEKLKEIYNPPAVVYLAGDVSTLYEEPSVSMVGTRSSSPEGLKTAFSLSYELAKNNIVVVSGGAIGIDSAAHKGALQAGGKTICVLGCGINYPYLMSNAEMRNQITKNGLLVSEYPPDAPPLKHSFPQRNRIISGLSQGTIVVEAGERSGSLITANLALEQNREVFAVPGSITNAVHFGTNQLIKLGAIPVTCAEDVLDEYSEQQAEKKEHFEHTGHRAFSTEEFDLSNISLTAKVSPLQKNNEKLTKSKNMKKLELQANKEKVNKSNEIEDERNKQIYLLVFNEPVSVNGLVEKTGFSVAAIMQSLTELELMQYVERKSGGLYYPV